MLSEYDYWRFIGSTWPTIAFLYSLHGSSRKLITLRGIVFLTGVTIDVVKAKYLSAILSLYGIKSNHHNLHVRLPSQRLSQNIRNWALM